MKILMQKKEVIRNETFDEEISALITFVKPQIYSTVQNSRLTNHFFIFLIGKLELGCRNVMKYVQEYMLV